MLSHSHFFIDLSIEDIHNSAGLGVEADWSIGNLHMDSEPGIELFDSWMISQLKLMEILKEWEVCNAVIHFLSHH